MRTQHRQFSLFFPAVATALLLVLLAAPGAAQETKPAAEPLSEASKQWLEEVVPYIITKAEKAVFVSLPTEAERGRFIESFWRKRDPDPSTPENEFKLDYYHRIALANKFFATSGIAGWRTERGRLFILLGPPQEVQRDFSQTDSTGFQQYEKETWQYWGLPNPKLPYNMEFVFVDKFGNGNFVLYKDYMTAKNSNSSSVDFSNMTYVFDSMALLAEAQKNPFENIDKLKTAVTTQVNYDLVPFSFQLYSFKGRDGKSLVPMIIEIPFSSLTPNTAGSASISFVVNISNSLGAVVSQISRDLNSRLDHDASSINPRIRIQTSMELEPGVYGIHIVIWDNVSGKSGTNHGSFSASDFRTEAPALSGIVLSAGTEIDGKNDPSTTAPVAKKQLVPSTAKKIFKNGEELEVGFEAYNLALNKETGLNDLHVEIAFLQGDKLLFNAPPLSPAPTAESECLIQNSFRLKNFKPGNYTLRISVTDGATGITARKDASFTIEE